MSSCTYAVRTRSWMDGEQDRGAGVKTYRGIRDPWRTHEDVEKEQAAQEKERARMEASGEDIDELDKDLLAEPVVNLNMGSDTIRVEGVTTAGGAVDNIIKLIREDRELRRRLFDVGVRLLKDEVPAFGTYLRGDKEGYVCCTRADGDTGGVFTVLHNTLRTFNRTRHSNMFLRKHGVKIVTQR